MSNNYNFFFLVFLVCLLVKTSATCTQNCQSCSIKSECSQCEERYFIDKAFLCKPCPEGCKTCKMA